MRKGRYEEFFLNKEHGNAIKVYIVAKPQNNESSISITYSFIFGNLYSTTMNNLYTKDMMKIYMNKELGIDIPDPGDDIIIK